jgi:hypothetical protein
MQEFIRAIMPLERAVALSNEWNIAYLTPIALAALGHVYARSGRVEEGVSWLQQALAGYGLRPVLAQKRMVGQTVDVLCQPVRIHSLDGLHDSHVEGAPLP